MVVRKGGSSRRGGNDGGGRGGDYGKLTPLQKALLKEAAREVSIVSNGVSQTIRMDEIIARKMMQMAANGGQHSITNAIYSVNMAQRLRQTEIDEEVARGHDIKARQQHLLDEARRHGRDTDTILPHPDDIVVNEGSGYELIGPVDETELRKLKRDCEHRDASILQAVLEQRLGPLPLTPGKRPSEHAPDESALLMAQLINDGLPKRFQKSGMQIANDMMRYQGATKRELLKYTHKKWASLGKPKPRGWRLPPLETSLSMLDQVLPAMMALYPDVKNGKLSVEATARKLQRMIGPLKIV